MASKKRWVVLGALTISNLCYGSIYAWSIFNRPLIEGTGLPIRYVSLAYSLMMITTFIFTLVSAPLLRRWGHRRLILLSAIFWCAGWFLTGYARSAAALYLFFSLLVGIGAGFGYNTIVSLIPQWFPDKKGLANGIAIGASGIAPLITAPLASALLSRFGVFSAFRALSLFFAVLLLGVFWLIDSPPAGYQAQWAPQAPAGSTPQQTGKTTLEMLQDPIFYLFWFVLLAADTSGMMMTGHAADIGSVQAGLSAQSATMLVSLLAVMNFTGRILFGTLSDKIGRYRVVTAILVIIAASMLLMGRVSQVWQFLVVFSLVGICFGAVMAVFPALCADCFGTKHMASNWSVMYSGYTAASFIGPFSAAACFEWTGSYQAAFFIAAGLSLAALIVFIVARGMMRGREKS